MWICKVGGFGPKVGIGWDFETGEESEFGCDSGGGVEDLGVYPNLCTQENGIYSGSDFLIQYYIQDIALWKITTAFYIVEIADIGFFVENDKFIRVIFI